MNISPVNSSKACFGKINWGTIDKAEKSATALRELKLANDLYGHDALKHSDVVEQLKILAAHEDMFSVSASIVNRPDEKGTFVLNVKDTDGVTPLDTFRASFLNGEDNTTPFTNDRFHRTIINSFAQKVITLHNKKHNN